MNNPARSEVARALSVARSAFVATGSFSFFINLLMLTGPLYMLQVYDRVLTSRSVSTLAALTVVAGSLLSFMGVLELIRSRVLVRIGARIDAELRSRVFETSLAQGLRGGFGQRSQALRDLDGLRQFLSGSGPFALFDAPWLPLYLVVVFLFHPLLGLIALAGASVLFTIAVLNELLTRRPLREAGRSAIAANAFAESSLRNAEAIEAMAMLDGVRARWLDRHRQSLAFQALASDRAGTMAASSKAVRAILQVAILGAGAALVIDQTITPGTMIAASIMMGRALAPVELAIGGWRSFVAARMAYGRLGAILGAHPAEPERTRLPTPHGEVSLERAVAVPPGAAKPVLKGISFHLAPGEALGVIGPSAAGKSSLARLLVGVWRPAAGSVRLDGAELHAYARADRGRHIGYLPQDVELFDGTVAENIARFSAAADDERIVAAARRARVHGTILRLPRGYDTRIGEGGSVLSGGERQRIALARALYGEPALVVLDEPNASLDADGDHALTEAILGLKRRGTTVVVIAHRPSAIAAVDKLLMLREGAVVAIGPKEEMLARLARPPAADSNIAPIRPKMS